MEDGEGDGAVVGDSETDEMPVIVTVALRVDVEKQPIFKVIVGRAGDRVCKGGAAARRAVGVVVECQLLVVLIHQSDLGIAGISCSASRERQHGASARPVFSSALYVVPFIEEGGFPGVICVQVGNTSTGEAPQSL